MTLLDYLNGAKGGKLVAVYGALITILNVNVLIGIMCIRSKWTDIPTGASAVVLLIIGGVLGSHLAERKIDQGNPSTPAPPEQ